MCLRVATVVLSAMLPLPLESMRGQTPPSLDFPPPPANAAMGHAGAAHWGELSALELNPALTRSGPELGLQFWTFQTDRIDERGFGLLLQLRGPLDASYAISFRQKGIEDLIDNPNLDESGLRVGDSALQATVARGLIGNLLLGISGTATWSTVFATEGRSAFLDLGAAWRPGRHLVLGASLRRLGSEIVWKTPGGSDVSTDLGSAIRLGASVHDIGLGPVRLRANADLETSTALAYAQSGIGLQASLQRWARFRVGLTGAPETPAVWTFGGGVDIGGFTLDLAYEELELAGPRIYLGLSYQRTESGSER